MLELDPADRGSSRLGCRGVHRIVVAWAGNLRYGKGFDVVGRGYLLVPVDDGRCLWGEIVD